MNPPGIETPWETEELLYDGDAFFDRVISEIDRAKLTVDLETYIYVDDQIGKNIAAALVRAANRGVQVRLIVDGIGASGWHERHATALDKIGVHVRIYHPVLFFNLWSRIKVDLGLNRAEKSRGSALISRLNRRDHRKMSIIDNRIGFVGSVNVTADHSAKIRGLAAWRDMSVRVEGGPVTEMTQAFNDVWERCHDASALPRWKERLTREKRPQHLYRFIRFNHTRKLRKAHYRSLLRRISRAKHRVLITNPYFAPSRVLLQALKRAARNGADVRILVPRHSDVFFMPWVVTAYYAIVLRNKARVFEYIPRILHSKTAVIDNWAVVGSSNFNRRSLVHDFEVDLVLSKPKTRDELVQSFETDLKDAQEVLNVRGGFTAWLGRMIAILLKNWI